MSTEMWAAIAIWETVEPTVFITPTPGEAWQHMARHLDDISSAQDNHPEGFATFASKHPFDQATATGEQAKAWATAYAATFEDDPQLEVMPAVPCGEFGDLQPDLTTLAPILARRYGPDAPAPYWTCRSGGACGCACSSGGFCGGCGHAGCAGRR
ncbi:hypothetical protein ACFV1N_25390 [Streptosporangium canum]|uniref:hypothetical protein n=1 Tax=Streptosporangium canum TaxID=324952 RepID=UPI0036C9BF55